MDRCDRSGIGFQLIRDFNVLLLLSVEDIAVMVIVNVGSDRMKILNYSVIFV